MCILFKIGEIDMNDAEGFGFIGKFCFTTNDDSWEIAAGLIKLDLTLTVPVHIDKIIHNYNFVLYSDEEHSWPKMWNSDASCETKTYWVTSSCHNCMAKAKQLSQYINLCILYIIYLSVIIY